MQEDPKTAAHESNSILNVLVLYEDSSTGLRGKRSVEVVPEKLHLDQGFNTRLWRWDQLQDPVFQQQAAEEGDAADVIILSAHGGGDLPWAVQNWLKRYLFQKHDRCCAIGVLLDAESIPDGAENRVLTFLKRLAAAAGAELFWTFGETGDSRRAVRPIALN